MTTEQHRDHQPPPTYRPRRSPVAGLPRITEQDRPSDAELQRGREQLLQWRRWRR